MLIVKKFGGSSLARPNQIKDIASQLAQIKKEGHQLILVVSAMGKKTDELVRLAYEVSPTPNRRELDMLLTTGERVSMSLMSMALHDQNIPAISFTGSQAGLLTNSSHSNARIMDLKPIRIEQALEAGLTVVVAGFQGVDPSTKEITTLGRGGSDTTAVAMASYFQAKGCQILKDVPGVHTADPRRVPEARALKQISYMALEEACFWGASVLHFRSVALARRMNVPLFIGLTTDPTNGTQVTNEVTMYEQETALSVNSHEKIGELEIKASNMAESYQALEALLQKAQLEWPQILFVENDDDAFKFWLTDNEENLRALLNLVPDFAKINFSGRKLSSVSLTCHGLVNSRLPNQITQTLNDAGISPLKLFYSPLSITALITQEERERAVKALHRLL